VIKHRHEGLVLFEIQQSIESEGGSHSSVNHDGCPVAVFMVSCFVFRFGIFWVIRKQIKRASNPESRPSSKSCTLIQVHIYYANHGRFFRERGVGSIRRLRWPKVITMSSREIIENADDE